jgi:hypothetical protein
MMKRIAFITIGAAVVLCSCAPITQYPIQLRFIPNAGYTQEKPQTKVITVAAFRDTRGITDPRDIGMRIKSDGIKIPFVTVGERTDVETTQAMKGYLLQKGYTVREETPQWDLNSQNVRQDWGDWVIGGTIDNFTLTVKSSFFKTFYEGTLKLKVVVVDVRQKREMLQETIELSSSYKTVAFRLETADRIINKLIARAVESALTNMEKR